MQLIILAAGKPYVGQDPSHLLSLASSQGSHQPIHVLDWIEECFRDEKPVTHCVIGYHASSSLIEGNHIRYHINPFWEKTGACGSLMHAPLDDDLFIHYGDILIHKEKINEYLKKRDPHHILVGIDESMSTRECVQMGNQSFSFMGCAFIPKKYIHILQQTIHEEPCLEQKHIGSLLEALIKQDIPFQTISMAHEWCDLDDPSRLPYFFLGTKAQTLQRLSPFLKHGKILPLEVIQQHSWRNNYEENLKKIDQSLGKGPWIVRSSAREEDSFHQSFAGAFDSFLNVQKENAADAISKAFDAYPSYDDHNEVLIQPMIHKPIDISGVVFTQSMEGAPYYIVNYTHEGDDTTGITGGHANGRVSVVLKHHVQKESLDPWIINLLEAVQEIEYLIGYHALDIEFCIRHQNVYILQVRPLVNKKDVIRDTPSFQTFERLLAKEASFIEKLSNASKDSLFFSIMSDWNPAEMIGFTPKPLAHSLYQTLITDHIWAQQRFEFGYQDLRHHPLMMQFCGHPYIDVTKSVQSFLPRALPTSIIHKITNFCIRYLQKNPHLHDKIEFDILPTCYGFSFEKWHERFSSLLSQEERNLWKKELILLTQKAFEKISSFFDKLYLLEEKAALLSKEDHTHHPWFVITSFIHLIQQYGTLPFAHLARCGFIAATMIKDLEGLQILPKERIHAFLMSIETVSSQLQKDAFETKMKKMSKQDFFHQYGHLRPGTYDIDTPTYASQKDIFLEPLIEKAQPFFPSDFSWEPHEKGRIENYLKNDLKISFDAFDTFIRQAIYGREYGKFIFTRYLSKLLSFIREIFLKEGVEEHLLPFLILQDIQQFYVGSADFFRDICRLRESLTKRKEQYDICMSILLPPTLSREEDFFSFSYPKAQPNFITQKSITAPCYVLPDRVDDRMLYSLSGKIILIEKADPGFDWLFSYPIAGLITLYGGANSHMAIRCHEFGLPAAIGVGDILYQSLVKGHMLRLDCLQRIMTVVQ